jgi:hypothetical protein
MTAVIVKSDTFNDDQIQITSENLLNDGSEQQQ